jgi:hypothetical protein
MFKQFKNMKFKPLTTFYNWLFVVEKDVKSKRATRKPVPTTKKKMAGAQAGAQAKKVKQKHDSSTPNINTAMDSGSTTTFKNAILRGGSTKEVKIKRARDKSGRYKGDDKSTPDINEAWVGGKRPKPKGRILPKNVKDIKSPRKKK